MTIILYQWFQLQLNTKIHKLGKDTLLDQVIQLQCARKLRQLRIILAVNLFFESFRSIYELVTKYTPGKCSVEIRDSQIVNEIFFFISIPLAHNLQTGVYLFIYWRRKRNPDLQLRPENLVSNDAVSPKISQGS